MRDYRTIHDLRYKSVGEDPQFRELMKQMQPVAEAEPAPGWDDRLDVVTAFPEPASYEEAFYDICDMLGIGAMPVSPKEAYITRVRPHLQAALATPLFQMHWNGCDEPNPVPYSLGAVAACFKDDARLVDVVNAFAALPLNEYLKDTDALWRRIR